MADAPTPLPVSRDPIYGGEEEGAAKLHGLDAPRETRRNIAEAMIGSGLAAPLRWGSYG